MRKSRRSSRLSGTEAGNALRRAFGCGVALALLAFLAACGGGDDPPALLTCDDSIKTDFKPDANTTVLLVKAFKKGDALTLAGNAPAGAPTAGADLCLVKLVVGPGSPGAASAPSTSQGIGMQVWLPTPSNWNQRIRNIGNGGWAGGLETSLTEIAQSVTLDAPATAALGYAVGTSDNGHTGHSPYPLNQLDGDFAMREDGSINTALWQDFSARSLHELAVKSKALARAYYGKAQQYAYWDGCSTGGRQGYKEAQENPHDYDGYLIGAPAINWTKFITSASYGPIASMRDLGRLLPDAKLGFASSKAVSACDAVGGQHLGFVLDPSQCRYDPTKDASALCSGVMGNGVVGTSTNTACVSLAEARLINKAWYGQTADGSVPDPAVDNAFSATLGPSQLWWGFSRGTAISVGPSELATAMLALELQEPAYGSSGPFAFLNATGNGADMWQQMSYFDLADAQARGVALQPQFADINTDNPDLSRLRDSGSKVLHYHGLNDPGIPPQGSINYYTRVADAMGGFLETGKFNKLYLIPGMGHCYSLPGGASGADSPAADVNRVPLPAPDQLFNSLRDWVENNGAPTSIVLSSADSSVKMPVCPFPQKATYSGTGSITAESSYSCK